MGSKTINKQSTIFCNVSIGPHLLQYKTAKQLTVKSIFKFSIKIKKKDHSHFFYINVYQILQFPVHFYQIMQNKAELGRAYSRI